MKYNSINSIINPLKFLIPDKIYLRLQFRKHLREKLNLKTPKTFNEKIQWLKLYDRKPEYIKYVDKYSVREYIKETIGEKYLIPLIGVYDNVEDIEWEKLPNKFVLKCTHGSHCNIICTDKSDLDIKDAKKKLETWMQRNWYWYGREWPYKDVKPRIVCEKFMLDESGVELKDYKIFCFNGEPKMIEVDYNRFNGLTKNLYDINWTYIPVSFNRSTEPNKTIEKPKRLDDMLQLASRLAKDYPFVRIDFYSISTEIYFGEITFYPISGFGNIQPKEFDYKWGSWINLNK
ncbi:ATP-grasp fold amidoligase family protein [Priestia megaterium]|uniref:ATP-grasp fold amidoligase family protein n=1 Tax=Priestia megaterium TaxID=1404 RepID=UPI00234F6394|nr:ATP-grasp fold amidoligase family protein [Priestia megaterium]MDC7723218.1 ATP-grasp fold amidoligase family protein [Priestia megaterium]